ncbi:MAG: hypothetical protein ACK2UM_16355 [Anaerolineales bacterium]|jgi:hypothetical protein
MPPRDFGMFMYEQQKGSKNPQAFRMHWVFYNIVFKEPNLYLTYGTTEFNGETFEIMLEFDDAIYNKILTLLPQKQNVALRALALEVKSYPSQIDFDDDYPEFRPQIGLDVKLGEFRKLGDKKYVPFVVNDAVRPEDL